MATSSHLKGSVNQPISTNITKAASCRVALLHQSCGQLCTLFLGSFLFLLGFSSSWSSGGGKCVHSGLTKFSLRSFKRVQFWITAWLPSHLSKLVCELITMVLKLQIWEQWYENRVQNYASSGVFPIFFFFYFRFFCWYSALTWV